MLRKVNRFMPTEQYGLLESFQGGEIYWTYSEDLVTDRSCLTIAFIRNPKNIKNPFFVEMLKKRGFDYLFSENCFDPFENEKEPELKNKEGIYEYVEFEDPHYAKLPSYIKEAKKEFLKVIEETDNIKN